MSLSIQLDDLFVVAIILPLQWQKMVQLSPFALQLHLLFAHGVSLLQPHFKSLSSSAGARRQSEGTIFGERAAFSRNAVSVGGREQSI